jgi:DNA-binding MarR family transcriptional regulator
MSKSPKLRDRTPPDPPEPAAPARSPAGDAISLLAVRIFQLHGALTEIGDTLAAPAGQTTARWQVMAAVEDAPRSVAQIARSLGLARQSVQRIADLLEADGLTSYEDNPQHLRAKLMRLTSRGKAALRTIQTAQRAWADRVGAVVGRRRLEDATAVLDEVRRALESAT